MSALDYALEMVETESEENAEILEDAIKELTQLRARIAELEANGHEAKSYLTRLVIHFGAEPLDYLLGLCTQIDNILTLVPKWQPIESAPKDGTEILCLVDGGIYPAVYTDDYFGDYRFVGWWERNNHYPFNDDVPTHWMPLPEPPEVKK